MIAEAMSIRVMEVLVNGKVEKEVPEKAVGSETSKFRGNKRKSMDVW